MVAMQAGADFIKTSTGKEGVNATLPVSLVDKTSSFGAYSDLEPLKRLGQVRDESMGRRQCRSHPAVDRNDRQPAEAFPIGHELYQRTRSNLVFDMAGEQSDDPASGECGFTQFLAVRRQCRDKLEFRARARSGELPFVLHIPLQRQ